MFWLKSFLKLILRKLNLRLSRYDDSFPRYLKAIESLNINLIFDVGANEGQFAKEVIHSGYQGRVISFEPTDEAYKKILRYSKKYDRWLLHDKVAIGDTPAKVEINVAGNFGASSSILNMKNIHKDAAPSSGYTHKEHVKQVTFDSIFDFYFTDGDICLLKIDVQGYEDQVLKGALDSINRIEAIKIECNIVSLYEGDKNYKYFFDLLEGKGFKLFDIEPGFFNSESGQLLQFDALFVRV